MKSELLLKERHVVAADAFAEVVVWRLPHPARGSLHRYKYRLALVVDGVCVMRYDNEAGKGDHRHVGEVEMHYEFVSYDALIDDFWADVEAWMESR
jgi:hypothetical protein